MIVSLAHPSHHRSRTCRSATGLRVCLHREPASLHASHLLLDDRKPRGDPPAKKAPQEAAPRRGKRRRASGTVRSDANAAKHPRNTTRAYRYASTVERQRSLGGTFSGIRRPFVSSRILRMCPDASGTPHVACVPQRQGSAYNAEVHTSEPGGYPWPKFR